MNLRTTRLLAAVAGSLALLANLGPALAQPADDYPSRPITVVVPYPPGGPPDVIARIVASSMEVQLGKAIIIENKPGAATALGTAYAARQHADGYTLLAVEPSFVVVPNTQLKPGYDPVKDFRPVSLTGRTFHTLGVATNVPVANVQELVKYANAHPEDIKIGHSGIGTPPYLSALSFLQATDAKILLVPYRGTALVVNDVVGGHVSGVFTGPSTTAALAKQGKLKILGITGRARIAALPDVPTFLESGIEMKGVNDGIWFGLVAPAGTPDTIIAKLNAAAEKASKDKAVIEKLQAQGIDPAWTTPKAMGDQVAGEAAHWHDALAKAGVKPE
ncbi:Bug family tripartite tricarboxylate transporter substrate binding protein [Rhodoplanes sp. Z2-YC6860]|uniref:Bug family tripartite tricarboxylate transporter substrate binding protein n=1 Tax=Rhodoplanes sp. Z2-YC6860 TaxID=674703 RepID=UPI00078CE9A1|nr:tripartite tricarboxylate transporter substrate binding protein [Rhodoplanes sp. Z2-YC6860]AMN41591.1 extra-cytoplasmic solute receptor [Rhodoplanes sp. Z2-YC6860]